MKQQKTQGLLHDTDSDDSDSDNMSVGGGSSPPWMVEYEWYSNTSDTIPLGMIVVEWWGLCTFS